MQTLLQDLKFSLRMIRKNRVFTIIAVLTLALGIGVNTAIFSVVNTVLLRPLPYAESEKLMVIGEVNPHAAINPVSIAPANFADYRDQNKTFQSMAFYRITGRSGFNLSGVGTPERVVGALTSAALFPTLGVKMELGRYFQPEEERPGSAKSVILSYALWERRFGLDRSIVGKNIELSGATYQVVGVTPKGFEFPTKDVLPSGGASLTRPVELWVPMTLSDNDWQARGSRFLFAVGRLKPGVSVEQAQADLALISQRLSGQYAQSKDWYARVIPMHEQAVGSIRLALLILFGAVGFVLLIACANVANLFLARAAGRQKEFAIRTAVGAKRSRIIRQLLTESGLMAVAGGLLGMVLAIWAVRVLISLAPGNIPLSAGVSLDVRVVVFTLAVSLLTALIFGLAPAFQTTKLDLNETLKDSGRTTTGASGHRLRGLLVISEIALAGMLMIGAALLVKSFSRLQNVDPGFDATNVLTFQISLPISKYGDDPKSSTFYQQLQDRLKALPGVESVSGTTVLPMDGTSNYTSFTIEGRPPLAQGEFLFAEHIGIFPNYFRTLRIPLLKGQEFTPQMGHQSTPVVIINESMARLYWPNDDPIGKRILIDYDQGVAREIVGVVSNVKHFGLDAPPKPEMYVPQYQYEYLSSYLTVRTNNSDPLSLTSAVAQATREVDPDLPIYTVRTMDQNIAQSVARQRFSMLLMSIFAAVAAVLSCIGLYGVIAYSVNQRKQEMGIRIALGAQSSHILKLIVGYALKLALIGVGISLVGAFLLTRLMSSLLYGVSAKDPLSFAGIAFLLIFMAILSGFIPARKATKVDPMVALRNQ
jgi:putative ABC transport system permease protein